MSDTINFLLVDDLEENLLSLEALLKRDGLGFLKARSGDEALEILLKTDVALALVDVQMPGMDGFQLAEFMRGSERSRRIPIIFVTAGSTDAQRRFRGYEAGAVDFIQKPVEPNILRSKAAVFFDLHQQRRQLQVQRDALEANAKALAEAAGQLDAQVRARTAELEGALARLKAETMERERVEASLRQSQKMEAVGQLTGGVAHDFNNLLTIIRSSVDFLKRPDLAPARRERYVTAISETVERASKLTGQLLAFARRQPLRPEVFDVGARALSVTELIRPLVGSRVTIEVDPCPEPCFTEADVSQFETALVNLAVNARDAMNGEGRLTLKVRAVNEVPSIRGHAGARGRFIAVEVSDTGAGIDPAMIASIFEPFFTTKEVGKGTGLGLSQVFGFAKQSGGEVEVQSFPGEGASFTLYLPGVSPDRFTQESQPTAVSQDRSFPSLCVLLVEDNEAVGRFADEMLRDLGYGAHLVGNASDALAALDAPQASYDVVFSDVIMPGMNGLDLAREVRRRRPELPVVLTSGYSNVLAQEGSDGFKLLRKPYSIEELSAILRRVVCSDRDRDPSSAEE